MWKIKSSDLLILINNKAIYKFIEIETLQSNAGSLHYIIGFLVNQTRSVIPDKFL